MLHRLQSPYSGFWARFCVHDCPENPTLSGDSPPVCHWIWIYAFDAHHVAVQKLPTVEPESWRGLGSGVRVLGSSWFWVESFEFPVLGPLGSKAHLSGLPPNGKRLKFSWISVHPRNEKYCTINAIGFPSLKNFWPTISRIGEQFVDINWFSPSVWFSIFRDTPL